MWRGSGCLPRHAARRGQKGYPVKKKIPQGLFIKIIFKKRLILKNCANSAAGTEPLRQVTQKYHQTL
jgi:hypothetical protein